MTQLGAHRALTQCTPAGPRRTDPAEGITWIDAYLGEWEAAAALVYELEHVRRSDSGLHRLGTERMIDECIARRFNAPGLYASADSLVGPDLALIADEIDLPAWVVEAWLRGGMR